MNKKIKINCDLGECLDSSPDKDLMPLIDMANIACGGHAGNDSSVTKTIKLASENKVKIGAHPSYTDKENFGRISQYSNEKKLFDDIYKQIKNFKKLCLKNNADFKYVKPHGALYHDMMHKKNILDVIVEVVKKINLNLELVVQAGIKKNEFEKFSKKKNIKFLYEVFADRAYQGMNMIPRTKPGAVFNNSKSIIQQYKKFETIDKMKIHTICFHGDNPSSINALKKIKNA